MIQDISEAFEIAHKYSNIWTSQTVRKAIQIIVASGVGLQDDWEEGDEEWGRVLQDNNVVAIVCARLPLVFLHSSLAQLTPSLTEDCVVSVVVVRDFDDVTYAVSKSLLERLFERSVSENVSCDAMSINDLWWATV